MFAIGVMYSPFQLSVELEPEAGIEPTTSEDTPTPLYQLSYLGIIVEVTGLEHAAS